MHSSIDIRRGDLQINITSQGGIAECPFMNPILIFGADEEESLLAYNTDERPSPFGELLKVCDLGVHRVEEVTARLDGRRSLFGFELPEVRPRAVRTYSCR